MPVLSKILSRSAAQPLSRSAALISVTLALITGCGGGTSDAATSALTPLTVDWTWKLVHKCSSTSPALVVSGIPSGVKTLQMSMVDLNLTSFNHGGGSVAHDGVVSITLPEGALKNYIGPCPPNFDSSGHDYQFTVKAFAADGQSELARGSKTKTFSSATAK